MAKTRLFSVYKDHKTGLACLLFFFLGVSCIVVVGLVSLFSVGGFLGQFQGSLLALGLIFLFVSGIAYFFRCQFIKLAEIAYEVESEDEDCLE